MLPPPPQTPKPARPRASEPECLAIERAGAHVNQRRREPGRLARSRQVMRLTAERVAEADRQYWSGSEREAERRLIRQRLLQGFVNRRK
jgi:hypothetical protein